MTARCLVLTGLVVVASSTIWAQDVSIVTFSVAAFGHDHSFTWSEDTNVGLRVSAFLAEEITSQTKEQLENVGLSLVAKDDCQQAEILVRLRSIRSMGATPLTLTIELYDAESEALIWRGEAKLAVDEGDERASQLIVDRTIAKMFEHFPYHLNGWMSAMRR